MAGAAAYAATRARVEDYFDRTASDVWARLTSDAPVSRVRATVRAGRDRMRALMLSRLPADLSGARILDAGCGAGQMSAELAARGAEVVGVDLSASLLEVARDRLPEASRGRVTFAAGDMLDPAFGRFDHVVAMDSLLYYGAGDIAGAVATWRERVAGAIVFTVAPRTPLLMAMWGAGRMFPRSDRSPTMVPHAPVRLARKVPGLREAGRVNSGFYISTCLEVPG